ncbi:MAG: M48 family metallopeptidase [Ignavibacteriae bacterium]|nr:M48 family metallopeptidase [Ignavibacteriota bacterium]
MKIKTSFISLVFLFLFVVSCSTVPVTGRKQLSLIPASQMMTTSFQQYDQFLKENPPSKDQKQTAMIKNVGRKIQKSVEKYFKQKNMSSHLKGYNWEFNLVNSKDVNAWCMPGGKVVFYTGILPICKDEAGVAVVMGHEIAHAIAEHGGERMSQGLLTQLGGMGLALALQNKPAQTQQLWMTAFGIGSQVGVMLPFSRLHESEADHLGLIFMAMAGYNPREAVDFWKRMAANKGGQAPPEFLSTHPSDQTRINNLQKLMPEALQYYKKR